MTQASTVLIQFWQKFPCLEQDQILLPFVVNSPGIALKGCLHAPGSKNRIIWGKDTHLQLLDCLLNRLMNLYSDEHNEREAFLLVVVLKLEIIESGTIVNVVIIGLYLSVVLVFAKDIFGRERGIGPLSTP